jgi:hypothetical protein
LNRRSLNSQESGERKREPKLKGSDQAEDTLSNN